MEKIPKDNFSDTNSPHEQIALFKQHVVRSDFIKTTASIKIIQKDNILEKYRIKFIKKLQNIH